MELGQVELVDSMEQFDSSSVKSCRSSADSWSRKVRRLMLLPVASVKRIHAFRPIRSKIL